MLDSLLQEVCIESGLPSLVASLYFLRTKESPLTKYDNVIKCSLGVLRTTEGPLTMTMR